MNTDQEVRWTEAVGERLRRARGSMSKREAARRAGFSEATWRALELGVRRPAKGIEVPVNPTLGNLEAAAKAVGEDPAVIFDLVGLRYDGQPMAIELDVDGSIEERVARLEEQMGATNDRLDRVLGILEADR